MTNATKKSLEKLTEFEKLQKLKDLYTKGLITQEVFEKDRLEIIEKAKEKISSLVEISKKDEK